MTVLSRAISAVVSMIAPSTGPRSDRRPTEARSIVAVTAAAPPGRTQILPGTTTRRRPHSRRSGLPRGVAGDDRLRPAQGRAADLPDDHALHVGRGAVVVRGLLLHDVVAVEVAGHPLAPAG